MVDDDTLARVPPNTRAGLIAMNANRPGIGTVHREQILHDIERGKYVKDVADELGVTVSAITMALTPDPRYLKAREAGLERKLETYQENIDSAPDGLALARAREGFRAASWRCEREHQSRWGRDPMIAINASGNVQIQVVSYADAAQQSERVIDSE